MEKVNQKGQQKRHVRARLPKVKTGCYTCRVRRVKCDEAKPACCRCAKFGTKCDGYGHAPPARKKTPSSKCTSPEVEPSKELKWLKPRTLSEELLSRPKFQNSEEYRCFQVFCDRTMKDLAGSEDSDLWNRIVLQASHHHESIRNAVVAIGALDQTLQITQLHPQFSATQVDSEDGATERYRFAIEKFGDSIQQMRKDIRDEKYDLRSTLISCILVVCFELFQGSTETALSQVSSGLEMLIAHATEVDKARRKRVDTSLIHIFLRLEQVAFPHAPRPSVPTAHPRMAMKYCWNGSGKVPSMFGSFKDARRSWRVNTPCMRRILDYMGLSQAPGSDPTTPPIEQQFCASREPFAIINDPDYDKNIDETEDQKSLEFQVQQLSEWSIAFTPLFNASRMAKDKRTRSQAIWLELRNTSVMLSLSSMQANIEMQYDKYTTWFKEILELSEEVLNLEHFDDKDSAKPRPIFTLEYLLVAVLWLVATKCRKRQVRRRAIDLLLEYPRREGVLDSLVVAKFATVLIQLEEKETQDDFIPEEARVRSEGFSFDMIQRRGRLSYSRGRVRGPGRVVESLEVMW